MTPTMRIRFELAGKLQQPVGFTYLKDGVRERRQIIPDADEPVREGKQGPYVIGQDLARDDVRSFRLDRMVSIDA